MPGIALSPEAADPRWPVVCVSIATADAATCLEALAEVDFAEIRLDAMRASAGDVQRIFAEPRTLIATCRPGGLHDDDARRRLLLVAIEAGAALVDVEVDAPPELQSDIVRAARAAGCRVIVSFHRFDGTPPLAELRDTIARCQQAGADIAKIACHVSSIRDAARLLGLLDQDRELVVVGLGPLGQIVRVVAPLLGSPIAYAAVAPGRETAPGQLDRVTLARWLEQLAKI